MFLDKSGALRRAGVVCVMYSATTAVLALCECRFHLFEKLVVVGLHNEVTWNFKPTLFNW